MLVTKLDSPCALMRLMMSGTPFPPLFNCFGHGAALESLHLATPDKSEHHEFDFLYSRSVWGTHPA